MKKIIIQFVRFTNLSNLSNLQIYKSFQIKFPKSAMMCLPDIVSPLYNIQLNL